jgi:hypothetical protein
MPVAIPNYKFKYLRKGKPVFVPTGVGKRIGKQLKSEINLTYKFDEIYHHLHSGGHVGALHGHRPFKYFAKVDIEKFFYSISRRRVQRSLAHIGISKPRFYAQWSTILNPYEGPRYALPYGFVQSPILATLVVSTSELGRYLAELKSKINVSVYMDDISLSSDSLADLECAYQGLLWVLENSDFELSQEKTCSPTDRLEIFNCSLAHGHAVVQQQRIAEFYAGNPSDASLEAFAAYCDSVAAGNS